MTVFAANKNLALSGNSKWSYLESSYERLQHNIIWLYACNICIHIEDKGDRVLAAKQETHTAWQKVAVAKRTVDTHSYSWTHENDTSLLIYEFMKENYPYNSSRSKPLGFFSSVCARTAVKTGSQYTAQALNTGSLTH